MTGSKNMPDRQNLKKSERLLLFPDISPNFGTDAKLMPPQNRSGQAYYLSWPAWEEFRLHSLGQSPPNDDLKPLLLPDPPAFTLSLKTLLDSSQDTTAPYRTPFDPGESVEELKKAIGSPVKTSKQKGVSPHLKLALWATSEFWSLQAHLLLNQALSQSRNLFENLREEPATSMENADFRATHGSYTIAAVFKAWLELADGVLTPEDTLWTLRDDFLIEAKESLVELDHGVFRRKKK
jgi:hypothetical protein